MSMSATGKSVVPSKCSSDTLNYIQRHELMHIVLCMKQPYETITRDGLTHSLIKHQYPPLHLAPP